MRNGLLLLLIAVAGTVNGLFLDRIQEWRWALFVLLPLVAYLQGRHLPVRRDGLLLAAVAVPQIVWLPADFPIVIGGLLSLGIFVTLPWLAGRFRRQQAELVRAGRERVEHLEREQRFVAENARLLERARIAADMHDVLGHELALISLRAGALELAPDLTDRDREAAAELRESAVSASDRLRHTVTGLRVIPPSRSVAEAEPGGRLAEVGEDRLPEEAGPGGQPAEAGSGGQLAEAGPGGQPAEAEEVAGVERFEPAAEVGEVAGVERFEPAAEVGEVAGVERFEGVAEVERLVGRARDAGMTIRLDPGGELGSAADGVYRVVREALTNAARHAPGAEVDVRWERVGDMVTVTVRNPVVGPIRRSESGTGINGLRDHLASAGGTLHAAEEKGVFTVTARLEAQ
ncbi:sensor histidine kinase [Actinoplanes couchii]|uniref:histidine kinase n=1 Tax=Actinoplanes couchii TaxID=403638 RepID=A0ABQ3X2G8_9ACTN|nr:histidine kinase [Actinoplanes couchii]GID52605.1 hypothetical protein Aco03nite_010090 [Actinoplanes couchii]